MPEKKNVSRKENTITAKKKWRETSELSRAELHEYFYIKEKPVTHKVRQ